MLTRVHKGGGKPPDEATVRSGLSCPEPLQGFRSSLLPPGTPPLSPPLSPFGGGGGARRLMLLLPRPLGRRVARAAPTAARRLALRRVLLWLLLLLLLLLHRTADHRIMRGGAMRPMEQGAAVGGRQFFSGSR